ncbi:transmembrane protein (DUF2215) [Rhynchospora pubera]|uniref:Transmembrane protein (DUF2215) n=1 Tax=Rhynchospora pubera TaxID=906938 RepID=A0AAV8DR62_9POAL|nr:transmembrane protein (DUF2215) [Rhynchospora pubera]
MERRVPRFSSLSTLAFPLVISLLSLLPLSASEQSPPREVNLEDPIIIFTPQYVGGHSCERSRISPLSRVNNLKSYANSRRVSLNISGSLPEKFHWKIEVCSHRNASLGLCECESNYWQSLHDGQWNSLISPYEKRYIDVRVKDQISTSFSLSIQEEFQQWRLVCLGIGFMLLILAPVVSDWAPFYYSSSMALGILLVVLLLLFQGMKLLPLGRKNLFYLTIYGSVLGIGSYIAHYFSTIVNSILVNFGLSEEMHNPVSVFLIVIIVLAGAALGYWVVRRFVLSADGHVDAGVAWFVLWTMRVVASFFILQSSRDHLLALGALGVSCYISYFSASLVLTSKFLRKGTPSNAGGLWQPKATQKFLSPYERHPEFLSKSGGREYDEPVWESPNSPNSWSGFATRAQGKSATLRRKTLKSRDRDYYSTYHNTPRRKFTKREWDRFTQEQTNKALAEWASSPDVVRWIADNAHRVHVDHDSATDKDDSPVSSSGSSEELEHINKGLGLLRWG